MMPKTLSVLLCLCVVLVNSKVLNHQKQTPKDLKTLNRNDVQTFGKSLIQVATKEFLHFKKLQALKSQEVFSSQSDDCLRRSWKMPQSEKKKVYSNLLKCSLFNVTESILLLGSETVQYGLNVYSDVDSVITDFETCYDDDVFLTGEISCFVTAFTDFIDAIEDVFTLTKSYDVELKEYASSIKSCFGASVSEYIEALSGLRKNKNCVGV